jgi:xylan 1,4-beta-xylosidase
VRPDRLTLTYQLFADRLDVRRPSKALRSLNVGQGYWVAVEAFNETGVSKLSRVVELGPACARPRASLG